jgi:hypothetical protein
MCGNRDDPQFLQVVDKLFAGLLVRHSGKFRQELVAIAAITFNWSTKKTLGLLWYQSSQGVNFPRPWIGNLFRIMFSCATADVQSTFGSRVEKSIESAVPITV